MQDHKSDSILLIEECSEVIKCITKEWRRNETLPEMTDPELADLFIVLLKEINHRNINDITKEIEFKIESTYEKYCGTITN
jgi:NTP pyrophosphatase (non-canonical NTP hydrolase)